MDPLAKIPELWNGLILICVLEGGLIGTVLMEVVGVLVGRGVDLEETVVAVSVVETSGVMTLIAELLTASRVLSWLSLEAFAFW